MSKKKKPNKSLPSELYLNARKGRKGNAEFKNSIHIRVNDDDFKTMSDFIELNGISQANFLRYALKLALLEVQKIVDNEE